MARPPVARKIGPVRRPGWLAVAAGVIAAWLGLVAVIVAVSGISLPERMAASSGRRSEVFVTAPSRSSVVRSSPQATVKR